MNFFRSKAGKFFYVINSRNSFLFLVVLFIILNVNNKKPNESNEQYKKFYRFNKYSKTIPKPAEDLLDSSFKSVKNDFIEVNFHKNENDLSNNKEFCKLKPDGLLGAYEIKNPPDDFDAFTFKSLNYSFMTSLQPGGSWAPKTCKARHRVALVIPYRNRLENLKYWLFNMHLFLQRQEIEYTVFIVEQMFNENFNKGILMNAAFKLIFEAQIGNVYDCILFHDIDLIPEDDLNLYSCNEEKPMHLSILVDHHDYRVEYPQLVGGVIIFKPEHYRRVNGYSNLYWGWGAEDDDMFKRLKKSKLDFERPSNNTRYTMLKHKARYKNPDRVKILHDKRSYKNDGLNSVRFNFTGIVKYLMVTHIMIDVGKAIKFKPTNSTSN